MTDKRKLDYWQLRAVQSEQRAHDAANAKADIIAKAYLRAQTYLTGEVNQIYKRYFGDAETTEAEAKQILNTKVSPTELVTLRALANNVTDKESMKQVTDYLSQMAAKGRITRLEELKAKSYIAVKQAASVEVEQSIDLYTKVIQDGLKQADSEIKLGEFGKDIELPSSSKQEMPETSVKRIVNPTTDKEIVAVQTTPDKPITQFKELSGKYVKAALDTPFEGKSYSQRIWHNTDQLAERLGELFTAQQMSGMRERDMEQALMKEFNVGAYYARRLIRTEANYFHNKTKLDEWKQRGSKQYQLVAVLDMRTSTICRNIDGKVYEVAKASVGVNYPPLHPNCRTVAILYRADSKYTLSRTVNDPITGKTMKLKPNENYHDWEKRLVAEHGRKEVDLGQKKVDNYRSDSKQYHQLQDDMDNKNVPVTLDNFQNMKYRNDEDWNELQDYHRQRVSGMLSPHMNFKDYRALYRMASKELIGVTTFDGCTVKSLSKHFMERFVGSSNNPLPKSNGTAERIRTGVHVEGIKDALINGKAISSSTDDTVKLYSGKDTRVALNFRTGNIIQVNPIHRNKEKK
ncbi:minor capsid protein [Lactiplantibacillus herbarum]|uniref:minor capsid protein n=1 Tax=Lactiplantibacillus herbarum TaxID=1670446 RepID=UPI0009E4051B|nr:minor capsid protein [Lactiplantibacillus herbarum]